MTNNESLRMANKTKDDEFYTRLEDIEKELENYKESFRGQTVLCNCDDPLESNFFRYFVINFNRLKLKKLISTSSGGATETRPCKAVVTSVNDASIDNKIGKEVVYNILNQSGNTLVDLNGDGDFRSQECLALLADSDIVCTNPPFSLFREYVNTLIRYRKKFVIIGNKNAITYKDFFRLLRNDEVRMGYNVVKEFDTPSGDRIFGNVGWYTNLETTKRCSLIQLSKYYKGNEQHYPIYDNYGAINVNRIKDIPKDYCGVMGVPITFMDKYDPEQFEIIGRDGELAGPIVLPNGHVKSAGGRFYINGERLYARIVIRNKLPMKGA